MPRIFISYRRSDSQDIAGRIYDRLVEAFSDDSVFMDVEGIQPGTSWRGKLRQAVTDSDVLLVLIGSTWLDTLKSRQTDPDDWVRYEIQMGLENDGTLVIPVLLQGTKPPSKTDLPDVIEDLVDSQSVNVRSGSDFRQDMDKLITFLRGLDQPTSTTTTPVSQPTNAKSGIRTEVLVAIITGIFVVAAAAIGILPSLLNQQPSPTSAAILSTSTDTPQSETATNTSAPPTSTDTPQPTTETPTVTTPPSETPQPSVAPTNTPAPPTNTSIPTIEPTTPAIGSNSITLTIFRDMDSLTLYMPETDEQVSLAGLVFQVEIDGQNRQFPLIGYSSFGGNSILGDVSVLNSAACFRLIRNGSRSPAPMECQNGAMPLTQNVADADVFWYDSAANQVRTVLVLKDGTTIAICATGQAGCEIEMSLSANFQTLNTGASTTSTLSSVTKCTAVVTAFGVNQVRVYENERITSSRLYTVSVGAEVTVLDVSSDHNWYKIQDLAGNNIPGWIESENFVEADRTNLNLCLQ